MTDSPWKIYKKGVDYIKKNGLLLLIKLPPGGKYEWIQAPPGFALENVEKEKLPKPYQAKTSDGKIIQISKEFMDNLKLITNLDLQRIIRNSSIILTNFNGPKNDDIFNNHFERLKKWIASNPEKNKSEFFGSLIMLDNLEGSSKEALPYNHYYEAGLIIATLFKLW